MAISVYTMLVQAFSTYVPLGSLGLKILGHSQEPACRELPYVTHYDESDSVDPLQGRLNEDDDPRGVITEPTSKLRYYCREWNFGRGLYPGGKPLVAKAKSSGTRISTRPSGVSL